jgi:hypothetical protein
MGALIKIKHQLKAMKEADETFFFFVLSDEGMT